MATFLRTLPVVALRAAALSAAILLGAALGRQAADPAPAFAVAALAMADDAGGETCNCGGGMETIEALLR